MLYTIVYSTVDFIEESSSSRLKKTKEQTVIDTCNWYILFHSNRSAVKSNNITSPQDRLSDFALSYYVLIRSNKNITLKARMRFFPIEIFLYASEDSDSFYIDWFFWLGFDLWAHCEHFISGNRNCRKWILMYL